MYTMYIAALSSVCPNFSGLKCRGCRGRLSSIGFWGKGRQRQELAAMIMRKCMSSLILKEKAHVLPRSIIGMETGSVKGLCPLEQSADLWISALERRHRACREQRDQSSQCSAGAGVGAAGSKRDPTAARAVAA